MTKPVWSLSQIVAQLTNWELRWDTQTPIAYAFYTQAHSFLSINVNFSPFSAPSSRRWRGTWSWFRTSAT